ncbi:MAG TPA: PspC domain-containing protein [Candidatus Limnocylindria bacterium]|nr:PspC domain-containing protein [Candidatus Limnocylindria bacterium]
MTERLYRSRDDRMIAGVAGGLAAAWKVDPSLIRIGWAVLAVVTQGLALLVYLVMAVAVPEEPMRRPPLAESAGADPLAATTASDAGVAGDEWQPADTPQEAPAERQREAGTGSLVIGALLVIGGIYFLVRDYLPQIDWDRVWPFALVAVGVVLLVSAIRRR